MGCGHIEHPDTCLCDVKPLGVRIQVDGVRDMWMGRALAELRGHSAPWTTESMLDYFDDLMHLYDEWVKRRIVVELPDELPACFEPRDWGTKNFQKWQAIRLTIQQAMDKYAAPMSTVLKHFGVSPQDFLLAYTSNRHHNIRIHTYEEVDELEAMLLVAEPRLEPVKARFGLTRAQWRGLRTFWRARYEMLWGEHNRLKDERDRKAAVLIRELCRDKNLGNTDIVNRVEAATGRRYDLSQVTRIRRMQSKEV